MPIRLDSRAPDFSERFRAFLATKREASADVEAAVRAIIADVAARGDHAVIELTRQFDRFDPTQAGLKVAATARRRSGRGNARQNQRRGSRGGSAWPCPTGPHGPGRR